MFSVGSIGAIGRGGARSLDSLWRLAGFTPSFDFPFARNRSLVDAVTGQSLITYTQASSGTYVNSDRVITTASNDEPRFGHNPTTGESLGLLVEEQRTNLLLQSAASNLSPWQRIQATVTPDVSNVIAPDGTQTADFLAENTATSEHYDDQSVAVTAGTTYVYSRFYKGTGAGNRIVWHRIAGAAIAGVTFNPDALSGISGASFVEHYPNGWIRVSTVFTAASTGSAILRAQVREGSSSPGASSYTGDGTSGFYTWGAQLEVGAFPTSYIPTTTAAATRSASLADLVSSAIANNIRSFYCEFRSPAIGACGVVSLNDNTANNRASVITSGTDPRLIVHSGGVEQANINGGTVTAGARTRVAVRINNNDFAISINGSAVVTDTSGTLPTVDRIMIGRTQAGEFLNNRIARFTGWNQLLGDATLRSLSSQ